MLDSTQTGAGRAYAWEERTEGITTRWFGRLDYPDALDLQEYQLAHHGDEGDMLLLLEHPPVYTTGRGGDSANLPSVDTGIPVYRIGRGGDATYHGPGQLVGYPIIDLKSRGHDVHAYLRSLEDGLIELLFALGVSGQRWPGRTGIWVAREAGEPRKIASIGIAVRRGIAWHGFALNVSVDLAPFETIVPCALAGVEMTSIAKESHLDGPSVAEAAALAGRTLPRHLAKN